MGHWQSGATTPVSYSDDWVKQWLQRLDAWRVVARIHFNSRKKAESPEESDEYGGYSADSALDEDRYDGRWGRLARRSSRVLACSFARTQPLLASLEYVHLLILLRKCLYALFLLDAVSYEVLYPKIKRDIKKKKVAVAQNEQGCAHLIMRCTIRR